MGKSVMPFSNVVDRVEKQFAPYRRCMAKADQARLDKLFNHARRHTPSGVLLSDPDPFRPMVLGMLLEILRCLEEMKDECAAQSRGGDSV